MRNSRIKTIHMALDGAQQAHRLGRKDAIQHLITAVRCMLHTDLEEEYHRYIYDSNGGLNYQSWLEHEKDFPRNVAKKIAGN